MKSILTALILLTASLATATVLYLEDFANTTAGTNFNTGWNFGNADASLASLVVDGVGVRQETWSQSTIPATPVGNSPVAGTTLDMGTPFTPFNGSTSKWMYTLEVAALGLTVSDVKSFQMDLRKRANANRVWFGILTGNKWYFSQNTLVPTLDDEVDPADYYRYRVPMDKMVEINQVWDNASSWGIDRTPSAADSVGPANLDGTESIDGFAILYTTWASLTGNMYIDNLAMTDEPVPAGYVPEVVMELPTESDIDLVFDATVGVSYQLERSLDAMSTWEPVGDPVEATSASLSFSDLGGQPAAGGKVFYRVSVASYKIP